MGKKIFLILVLAVFLSGSVFAERHEAGDMLLGIDLGFNLTPSFFSVTGDSVPKGNYAITFDLGLNFDYYLFNWLSFNSGLFMYSGIYLLLDKPLTEETLENTTFTDWAKTPICLTIPLMGHVNIPAVDFLYLGAGLNFNLPVSSMLSTELPDVDTKGKFFLGIPIDLGFDFIKSGKGGSRFFFRITPEIHSGGTPVLIGFMWQIYNFRIYGK